VSDRGEQPCRPDLSALERRIIDADAVRTLDSAWQNLAERAARSPFESPAWLLPWVDHYGSHWQLRLITWWRGNDLVAVAPIAWRRRVRRGLPVRELTFWGRTETPLRGWVDIVADEGVAQEVATDFAAWLARPGQNWDLFHYLHLAPDSPTLAALAAPRRPWRSVSLTRVLHSLEYGLTLPDDASNWRGPLGPKARHEIRRQIRLYERRMGGCLAEVADPTAVDEIVVALRSLVAERWGDREAYFARDPRFGAFVVDALRRTFGAGIGRALVARDAHGLAACLVVLDLGPAAAAILIGVTDDPEYRSLSLGKGLFHRAIAGAAVRGCRTFSFLTEDGYKASFWHAQGRPTESGVLARGAVGSAVAAYITATRVLRRQLQDRALGRGGDPYRP
jgi:GNAT superfamily N-acetyltransferase